MYCMETHYNVHNWFSVFVHIITHLSLPNLSWKLFLSVSITLCFIFYYRQKYSKSPGLSRWTCESVTKDVTGNVEVSYGKIYGWREIWPSSKSWPSTLRSIYSTWQEIWSQWFESEQTNCELHRGEEDEEGAANDYKSDKSDLELWETVYEIDVHQFM